MKIKLLLILSFLLSCKQTVLLQFSTGGELSEYEKSVLKEFEELNPHIKIRPVKLPVFSMSQHDSYVTYLSAGQGSVDVFAIDVIWLAEFAQSGFIAPLDDYYSVQEREIYLPKLLEAGIYETKLYGIPGVADLGLLYFHKKLARMSNIKIPKPLNWENIFSLKTAKKIYPLAFQAGNSESLICNLLEFFPQSEELYHDLLKSLKEQKKLWITALSRFKKALEKSQGKAINFTEKESSEEFLNNQAFFLRNWPYFLTELRKQGWVLGVDFEIYSLPEKPTIGGWYLVINESSPHKEEAALFLKYMTGKKIQYRNFQELYAQGEHVGLPSLKEFYEDEEKLKNFPELLVIKKSLEKARARFISAHYYEYSRILLREIRKFLQDRQNVDETIHRLIFILEERNRSS